MDDGDFIGKIIGDTHITDVNFGYPAPDGTTSDIGDRLFYDWDGQGDFDIGIDEGLPFVDVHLYDPSGTWVETMTTDIDGNYLFEDYPAGVYTVEVDVTDPDFPAGLVVTNPGPGSNWRVLAL